MQDFVYFSPSICLLHFVGRELKDRFFCNFKKIVCVCARALPCMNADAHMMYVKSSTHGGQRTNSDVGLYVLPWWRRTLWLFIAVNARPGGPWASA